MASIRPVENLYTTELERNNLMVSRDIRVPPDVTYRLYSPDEHLCHASFTSKPYDLQRFRDAAYQVETNAIQREVDPEIAKAFMRVIHYDFDMTGPRDGDSWREASLREKRLIALYGHVGYKAIENANGLLLLRKNTH